MNLLFDLACTQPNSSGKRHGGGKYGEIIFIQMIRKGIKFSCFYDSRYWINPQIKDLCNTNSIPLYDLSKISIKTIIEKYHIDRLYSAIPQKLALTSTCEIIGTVHGLRELETPLDKIFFEYKHSFKELLKFTIKYYFPQIYHQRKKKQYIKYYLNSPLKVITVSEHSKYAFMAYFPESRNKEIKVFYSPNTSPDHSIPLNNNNEKYFMLVSGNRWEKNNLRAIKAFDRLVSMGQIKDVKMKVTGTDGNCFRYKIQNPTSFEFLGYVDEEQLDKLYANAYLFIYPSLNEGFGYPPIEAMKYKTPVIASPLSSIAEICGEGVLFFNPFSVEEIMNRMMMMMDTERHQKFAEKGYNQYLKIKERQEKDLDLLIDYISQ